MLNVIAFGPFFFDSIKHLNANMHRAIARDLLSSKLVYMTHRDNPEEEIPISFLVDSLLRLNDDEADYFDEQIISIWRRFLEDVYKYKSNRLLPKNFNDFFDHNKQHAKNIWMHPSDAAEFNLCPSQFSNLSFEEGIASDEFHKMLNSRRFNKAFSDENNPEDLLAIIDEEVLDLPSQFYKTIILFDKWMAYSFFKHQYTDDKGPYKRPKDPRLNGFVRFLRHLEKSSQSIVTGVVLIGEYPKIDNHYLLGENNTEIALQTLQNRCCGKYFLSGLQVEVMFVCPWDFPDVYHDRYCAWSSSELDHDGDGACTRFLDYFEICFGNSERPEFRAADFWLQSGRGLQVYEEVNLHKSWQNVTFDWASDIDAMEYDLFYRFFSWPDNIKDTSRRYKWASIRGNSDEHGFSDVYCATL